MTISNHPAPRGPPSGRTPKAPLKSPLAARRFHRRAVVSSAADIDLCRAPARAANRPGARRSRSLRDYLRTVNNRDGRPYEEKTISAYVGPGEEPGRAG